MKEMTKGNPLKIIFLFSLPILFGNIFQQFYNMADTIMVGRILGVDALAAMGATASVYGLVLMLSIGAVTGFSIPIAQYFGAQDETNMKKAVANTFLFSFIIGIVITLLSLFLAMPVLHLLNTPDNIIHTAYEYLMIIFGGTMITILYNLGACILRAVGDSKTPLYFLILSSILNIGLDYIFIKIFSFGVSGAAIATLIAQGISVLLCLGYVMKKYQFLQFTRADFALEASMVKNQWGLGLSMALMNSVVSIGSVILQSGVNGLGSTYIAGHTAARKISEVFMQPMGSIGVATTTFASQNFGAKKFHRILEGVKKSILLTSGWSLITIIISFGAAPFLISFFVDESGAKVVEIAAYYLRANSIFYFALGILLIYRNVLQGIGKKAAPIISSFVEMAVKVVATFFFTPYLGYTGIVYAEPVAWVLMAVLLSFSYRRHMHDMMRLNAEEIEEPILKSV